MPSTTVRINETTREALRELATETGSTMQDVLEKAIDEYRRRHFFEQVDAAYAVLRENPEEWQAEVEERKVLEGTLADGIEE